MKALPILEKKKKKKKKKKKEEACLESLDTCRDSWIHDQKK